jgi:tetratricopeptide (TPR) repeat protein
MSAAVRLKPIDELNPYEAVLRTFGYYERLTPDEHAATRDCLERAVGQAPGNADCWAMLSLVSGEEYRYGFNAQPDPLDRAYEAAKRAVDLATENHFARLAIAMVYYYRKEFDAFRNAAERAVALNPMDGYTLARMGMSLAFAGDWERGCELTERARQVNPNHPGWYWATSFNNAYRKGEYRQALSVMANMDMRGLFFHHLNLAAVYGQLGDLEAGSESVKELLKLRPNFAVEAREEMLKQVNTEIADHLIEGLRKAGLDIPDAE